jgi:D-sedoheptulose 7-phosphate isomerase
MCVGHLGEQIEAVAGRGDAFGLEIRYAYDGPHLLGTGGAVQRALSQVQEEACFVLYGDSYLECGYAAVQAAFEGQGKAALMTVFRNEQRWDASNIEFSDGRIRAYNKVQRTEQMRHIDYGLGVVRKEAFARMPDGEPWDLAALYQALLHEDQLGAFEVFQRFHEIGSVAGLEEIRRYLADKSRLTDGDVMDYSRQFIAEARQILDRLDVQAIAKMVETLDRLRLRGGRLFILGVGGSAANASHAVNDFRKITGIEAYAPTDNVSELTARTNDEGWSGVFAEWLRVSRLTANDAVLVFSVGGGNLEKNVSPNLVAALRFAKEVKAGVLGIVGRDGGYTAQAADVCVIVPTVNPDNVTPHAEAFQAVVWHLLVSHPRLKRVPTKWEKVA